MENLETFISFDQHTAKYNIKNNNDTNILNLMRYFKLFVCISWDIVSALLI